MAFVLGLTGGIGSGKTAVSDRFATMGVEIIDADIIAHQVVAKGEPALHTISERFGSSILLEDGELDRGQLRQIIFAQAEEKQWLENFLHPLIRQTITEKIATATPPYCVLVAPLLLEGNLYKIVDRIALVDCTEEIQIKRATQRDNIPKDAIENIIKQQMSRAEKLKRADIIITNEGTLESLYKQVDELHSQLIKELTPQ